MSYEKKILTPEEREAKRTAAIEAIEASAKEAIANLQEGHILREDFADLLAANARTSALLQAEHARRLADIPLTPKQCLECLKEHARAQVRNGLAVKFVTYDGTTVSATFRSKDLSDGDAWNVYRSGGANAWSHDESTKWLLEEIDDAVMVAI